MSNEEIWAAWDEAVNKYVNAMDGARTAQRALKQRQAITYDTLKRSGKGVEDSRMAIYADPDYIAAWREADEAEIAEKHARLALEKLQLQIEVWRTRQATRRAEMNLR